MESKMLAEKAGITAALTAICAALGWRGIMAMVWVLAMALDYISGTAAACKAGQWSSAVAREGLWHKGGMILVVAVAGIADLIMGVICNNIPVGFVWPGIVLPLVLAWYIVTELGSVLENAVKMGASVPNWLISLLKVSLKAVDSAGETISADTKIGTKEE